MTRREDQTVLSYGNSIVLLSALYEKNGPMSLDDMRQFVPSGTACLRFMDDAEAQGLVDIQIFKKPRRMYSMTMTDFGRQIASFLLPTMELVAPDKPLREKSIASNHAASILNVIRDGSIRGKTHLLETVPCWRTVTNLLDALEEDGLIESTISSENRKHWEYRLTPLGMVVANSFQMATDQILSRYGEDEVKF